MGVLIAVAWADLIVCWALRIGRIALSILLGVGLSRMVLRKER